MTAQEEKEHKEIMRSFQVAGKLMEEHVKRVDDLEKDLALNQASFDELFAKGDVRKTSFSNKSFDSVWQDKINEAWASNQAEIKSLQTDKDAKLTLNLKVANMTTASTVTGDVVHSYNNRQGLVPNQNTNMRDIIPTTISPTGSFVTYKETGSTGSISVQTEGQSKTQIDYAFTEIKTVSKYIAGFAVVSKQILYHLPFLQQTLPRILMRDFFKKENQYLYDAMIAAAEADATAPASAINDAEEILYWISNLRDADYNASAGVLTWGQRAHLLATRPGTGSPYSVPGSMQNPQSNGVVEIDGVPMIGASFADPGEFLLFDRDFVERVVTEEVNVTFSYEDSDNFRKNLVTCKIEAFEELNVLRGEAILHGEFGGS